MSVALGIGGLNPLSWLGDAAGEVAGEGWASAMTSVWSGGVWLLNLSFHVLDSLTTPDLSAAGPMGKVYPYTFGIGASVALVMAFVQIGTAAVRRDGQSLGRLLLGLGQYAVIWAGYVGVAAALVTAASGLTHGLLHGLLNLDGFSGYDATAGWPRQVTDNATATVLGLSSLLLLIPASIAYLLLMLVREAALLLLVATSPIAAGGLLSEVGRTWFWKSLRWFLAALLVAPVSALVLGVGHVMALGVVSGAGDDTVAAVGMAVVACLIVLVGALCPVVLFRLLAFVDPGTSSGAAMRTSLAAQGGLSGLVSRSSSGDNASTGTAVASQGDGSGRSSGEANADATTATRFAANVTGGARSALGGAVTAMGRVTQGAVAIGSDIAASTGIGHSAPYYPSMDPAPAPRRPSTPRPTAPATPKPPTATPTPEPAAAAPSSAEAGLIAAG